MQGKSEKIKATLRDSGLSQTDLAKKLGISRQQLHEILKEDRKSKYLDQIAQVLKIPELAKDETLKTTPAQTSAKISDVQRLPLVFPEDILRIWEGHHSVNLLNKPFYNIWPFAEDSDNTPNHFCLRLNEYLNFHGHTLGAFHLFVPLKLVPGHVFLIYLKEFKKLILGTLEINSETGARSIINNKGIYFMQSDDIILAECAQIVSFL